MYDTTTAATLPRVAPDLKARAAGLGALGFATVVIAQNVIRGGSAPTNGASAQDVLDHYVDGRATTFVLMATFVVGGTALATFLGASARRLLSSSRSGWAATGLVAATGLLAIFAIVVGSESALSVVANGDAPDLGAIQALWALHNAVFSVLYLFIGIALVGLSRAGVAAGITPKVFERLAPVGFGLLAVGTVAGPAIAGGDAMPLFGLAGLGFLVWVAFIITTGLRLVREQVTA